MKLGLGTAQFGLDYGISNVRGRVNAREGRRILDTARHAGVSIIDTAPAYGDSEAALGELLRTEVGDGFRIITKTSPLKKSSVTAGDADALKSTLDRSLARLQTRTVYGLLSHHVDDVLVPGGENLVAAFNDLISEGKVQKWGVSIYTAGQIDAVLQRYKPQIIQVPLNVFDQRLIQSGHLARLKASGVEIHARSIFLQGLLLMDPASLDLFFESLKPHFQKYLSVIEQWHLSRLEAPLRFVANCPDVDCVLVGVSSCSELEDIIKAWRFPSPIHPNWSDLAFDDEKILNPARWKVAA